MQELDHAISLLARALVGAAQDAEQGGIASLPRPRAPEPQSAKAVVAPQRVHVESAAQETAKAESKTVVQPTPRALPIANDLDPAAALLHLQNETLGMCTRCKLHRGRNSIVFGVGNPQARLVFVGEGPGADEDKQGIPFVGKAGQLLTKMIEAMQIKREDVYICNVVKCRPPNNRDPEPDEVAACEPFLQEQLRIISPDVIVTLGRYAAHALLQTKTPITKLRGTWQSYQLHDGDEVKHIPVMPTYHPSYLLRDENDPEKKLKREAWSDLKQVMQRLPATGAR